MLDVGCSMFALVTGVTRPVTPYIVETRIYLRIMKQPNIEAPKHRNTEFRPPGAPAVGSRGPVVLSVVNVRCSPVVLWSFGPLVLWSLWSRAPWSGGSAAPGLLSPNS